MRIESSHLGYMKIPGNSSSVQQENISQNRVKERQPARAAGTAPAGPAAEPGRTAAASVTPPLSKYLSTEEKEMLAGLFPSSGRNTGVAAYAQGRHTGSEVNLRGNTIDVTS